MNQIASITTQPLLPTEKSSGVPHLGRLCLILLVLGSVLFSSLSAVPAVQAQGACISLTAPGSAYSQDFNTLSNAAGSTANNLTITGWYLTESGGGARDNEQYAVGTGSDNTGDTYSYGTAGSTERALGGLRTGITLIPIFGACFTNNTGSTLASLDVAYTGEEWRLGTAARTDQINFEYSTSATDMVTGTWTAVSALNFVTPDIVTTGAKNGNAAGDRTARSSTINDITIPNGSTFWIRWTDPDATSFDDGLAIDDFSLTPQATAEVMLGNLNQVYDGIPKSATATTNPAGLTVTITYDGNPAPPTNAGSYAVVATVDDPNYSGSASGTLVIGKAPLTVTADDKTKTYGGPMPLFTASYSGFVAGQDQSVLGGALSLTTPASAASDVGTYPITPSGLTSTNYAITFLDGTLTVSPAPLTVTADDKSKEYGATLPVFTANYSGFVLGQTPGILGGALSFSTAATQMSPPGTYAVTPDGLTSTNYDITFVNGTLTVTDTTAPVLISFTRQNPAGSPTNSNTLVFRVTFDEDVQNVDPGDFAVTGTTATITLVTPISASIYDITVSGGDLAGLNGTVGLGLVSGQNITDLMGNALPAGEPATDETYVMDNSAPAVISILRQTPTGSPTNAASVTFRVTFGEDMQNVDTTDFTRTVSGTATGTVNSIVVQSASVYDVVVTGVGGNGILDLNIAPGNDLADLLSNALGASPTIGTEETYIIDTTPPIVLYGGRTAPDQNSALLVGPTQIVVEFSEDVIANGGTDAANTLANYLLVEARPNDRFDTLACAGVGGGLQPDDARITVNSVAYSNGGGAGPFLATLNINGGTRLPIGDYRLFICGTSSIYDPAGNRLNNGADSLLNFSVRDLSGLPTTGFAPDRVTLLPPQAVSYADLGDLWIEIPKLKLKTNITGVPLEAAGWDVTWLNWQVGWLEGTAYPTWEGNTVLTAHGYTADGEAGPFALLKNMSYGETIVIHLSSMKYIYAVRTNLLISPNDTRWLTRHETLDWITLITCQQYDAKTKSYRYRRVVRAVLVSVEPE